MDVQPVNPCQPSPCGPNAECREIGNSPSCICLREYIGSPPNCRPECASNTDCSSNLACINMKCRDPCPGACGLNAECRVISHTPMCICQSGFAGDPFSQCSVIQMTPQEQITPCSPSPCGSNAVCREQNGAGSCTCLPDYIGNPYEGCRPECILNSDCPSNRACIRSKCADPCPGTCGSNAECQVVNHLPSCTCRIGYTGDPFKYCNIQQNERKTICFLRNLNQNYDRKTICHSLTLTLIQILNITFEQYFNTIYTYHIQFLNTRTTKHQLLLTKSPINYFNLIVS